MKYITDITTKDVTTKTFIINVFDWDMGEENEYKFVFTSTNQNIIIKYFIDGALQRVFSYTCENFTQQYKTYRIFIMGIIEACNADDYDNYLTIATR